MSLARKAHSEPCNKWSNDLTRNVYELRRKLARTEESINNLEVLSQKSSDMERSLNRDDLSSTSCPPPPLTVDELRFSTSSPVKKHYCYFNQPSERKMVSSQSSEEEEEECSVIIRNPDLNLKRPTRNVSFDRITEHFDTPMPSPQRPVSARSNATTVTVMASSEESARMRRQLAALCDDNSRLRNLVTSLQARLDQTSTQMSMEKPAEQAYEDLYEQIQCFKEEIQANSKTLRLTEDKLEMTESKVAEKDQNISELRQEIAKLHKFVAQVRSDKMRIEMEKSLSLQEMLQMSQKIRDAEASVTSHKKDAKLVLQATVQKAEAEYNQLMQRFAQLQLVKDDVSKQLRTSKEQMQRMENEKRSREIGTIQALEDAQKKITDLIREIDDNRSALKEHGEEVKRVRADETRARRELERVRRACEDDKQQLEHKLNRDKHEAVTKAERLTQQLALKQEELDRARKQLKEKEEDLQDKTITGAADAGDAITSSSTSHNYVKQLSELKVKLATKEAQIVSLEAELSTLTDEGDKLEQARAELASTLKRAKIGERKVAELENLTSALKKENCRLTEKMCEMEDSGNERERECESLEKRLNERTQALVKHKEQTEASSLKLVLMQEELTNANQRVSSLEKSSESLRASNKELEERLVGVGEELEEKAKELEREARSRSESLQKHQSALEQMSVTHQDQCRELMQHIEKLERDATSTRCEATAARQQIARLTDSLEVAERDLRSCRDHLALAPSRDHHVAHDIAMKNLEQMASSDTRRVQELEGELAACKKDVGEYVDQITQLQQAFQDDAAAKNLQVAQLEADLALARSSLHEESDHVRELEEALKERSELLRQAGDRVAQLDQQKEQLDIKVSLMSEQHAHDAHRARDVICALRNQLDASARQLEGKHQQFADLNQVIERVDGDFRSCKEELVGLEEQVRRLREENEEKAMEVERSEFERREMKSELDDKIEQVGRMKDELSETGRRLRTSEERCAGLEQDVKQVKSQIQMVNQSNLELQAASDSANSQMEHRQLRLQQLEEALRIAREELERMRGETGESARLLDDRSRELAVRNAQVEELRVELDRYRCENERKLDSLRSQLQQAEQVIQDRNAQVGKLDEQASSLRSEKEEQLHLIRDHEQQVERMRKQAADRDEQLDRLKKELEVREREYEDAKSTQGEIGQLLRLCREREQIADRQAHEWQLEMSKLYKEIDSLQQEAVAMETAAKEKDEQLNGVSRQLTELLASRAQQESNYNQQFLRVQKENEQRSRRHQHEIENLMRHNGELIAANSAANHKPPSHHVTTQTAERSQEREAETRAMVIDHASDAILVKDAEIARLQAKVSGLERELLSSSFVQRFTLRRSATHDDDDDHDVTEKGDDVTAVHVARSPSRRAAGRWTSDGKWRSPRKLSTGSDVASSIFTGGESEDLGFVPIAAGPPVPITTAANNSSPASRRQQRHTVSFVTSSPAKSGPGSGEITGDSTPEENSLCNRLFGDLDTSVVASSVSFRSCQSSDVIPLQDNSTPSKCLERMQEKLAASDQRRAEVHHKLRQLKHANT